MKIAMVVYDVYPQRSGGCEIRTMETAKLLTKLGHDVHIITQYPHKEVSQETTHHDGIAIHNLGFPCSNKRGYKKTIKFGADLTNVRCDLNQQIGKQRRDFKWRLLPARIDLKIHIKKPTRSRSQLSRETIHFTHLHRTLKTINPDIIQSQVVHGDGWKCALIARLLRKPFIASDSGYFVRRLPRKRKEVEGRITLNLATKVVASSKDMLGDFSNYTFNSKKIVHIPHGIDLTNYINCFISNKYLKMLLYFGNLNPHKGVKYLIEAMEQFRGENIILFICGDGSELEKLKKLSKELGVDKQIFFHGNVDKNILKEALKRADVVVHPALIENFSNTLLQAMASGKPIVATDVGGVSEMLTSKNAILVAPKSASELANGIRKLLGSEKLRTEQSKNNLERVKRYSWDVIIPTWIDLYESVCKKNSGTIFNKIKNRRR